MIPEWPETRRAFEVYRIDHHTGQVAASVVLADSEHEAMIRTRALPSHEWTDLADSFSVG